MEKPAGASWSYQSLKRVRVNLTDGSKRYGTQHADGHDARADLARIERERAAGGDVTLGEHVIAATEIESVDLQSLTVPWSGTTGTDPRFKRED